MHNYTFDFFIKKEKINQKGLVPIYYNCSLNGQRFKRSIYQNVLLKNWNNEKRIAKGKRAKDLNKILAAKRGKANDLFLKHTLQDVVLTKSVFLRDIEKEKGFDFIEFIRRDIEDLKKLKSKGTIKIYKKALDHLLLISDNIPFSTIDLKMVEKYEAVLKGLGHNINTRSKYQSKIKFFVGRAIDNKLLEENPYENFKIKTIKGKRDFIEENELKILIDLYNTNCLKKHLQECLRQYLFMCSTGLRISDLKQLTDDNIKNGNIIFKAVKTAEYKNRTNIPLNDFSKMLIDDRKGKLFDCYKNDQTLNENLKKISKIAEIEKHITTHTGRHTFATIFLAKGGKIEVLKELLNHSDIKTTMIYAHIVNKNKQEQIQVFNDFVTKK